MILKVESYFVLEDEDISPEGIERIVLAASGAVVETGYGNVADVEAETVKLRSIVVARAEDTEFTEDWWQALAEDAMSISFPSDDDNFVDIALAGGIPEA